jgi:hypothetical protein
MEMQGRDSNGPVVPHGQSHLPMRLSRYRRRAMWTDPISRPIFIPTIAIWAIALILIGNCSFLWTYQELGGGAIGPQLPTPTMLVLYLRRSLFGGLNRGWVFNELVGLVVGVYLHMVLRRPWIGRRSDKPWGCQWSSCRVRAGVRGGRESLSHPGCFFVISLSISAVSITCDNCTFPYTRPGTSRGI